MPADRPAHLGLPARPPTSVPSSGASAAIELLLNSTRGRRVAARIDSPEVTLHAPEVIDLEVCQALRRYVRLGKLEPARAHTMLELFDRLDLTHYPHGPLLPRIWQLRENLSAYDGAYVALAEGLEAPMLTTDERLANAPVGVAVVELA